MINELKDRAYQIACKHGWFEEERSMTHYLMLVITELSEAINSDRKGKYAQREMFLKESVTPQSEPEKHWAFCFETFIKDTVEDELADAVIRIMTLAGRDGAVLQDNILNRENFLDLAERKEKALKERGRKLTFPEEVYLLVYELTRQGEKPFSLSLVVVHIFMIAYARNIDLFWFIEQKLKYNESRPYKHGKKY